MANANVKIERPPPPPRIIPENEVEYLQVLDDDNLVDG